MTAKRIAIIDLGSNTARLIVMQAVTGYSYRLVDELREVVRLRQGMTGGQMQPEAVARAFSALRLFKQFCESTRVDQIYAVATSAVRDAQNGPAFLAQVRDEIGLELQVIDGEQEAEYGVIGALNEWPMTDGYVLDIGGGSAQVSRVAERRLVRGESRLLGALALTEQFVKSDPISARELAALRQHIEQLVQTLPFTPGADETLLGVGGTIRNLADIEVARQEPYPLNTLHGFALTRQSVEQSIAAFASLPLAKRKQIRGLKSDRADIILAGAMVVEAVMAYLGVPHLTVSLSGVREGVFATHFWGQLAYPVIADVRQFSVVNLARTYDYPSGHANHVRGLSLRLFDQLQPLHGCTRAGRDLLAAAALLHTIGTTVSYTDAHKHAQYLIVNNGLPGYTPRETAMIALLARYQRKGQPSAGELASLLEKDDEEWLVKLGALLRVATAAERARAGVVQDVFANWDNRTLWLKLLTQGDPTVALWSAEQTATGLLEKAFNRRVVWEARPA